MWHSRQELAELEDEVFDLDDGEKGTLIFSVCATSRRECDADTFEKLLLVPRRPLRPRAIVRS
jgi:hypothetical protein